MEEKTVFNYPVECVLSKVSFITGAFQFSFIGLFSLKYFYKVERPYREAHQFPQRADILHYVIQRCLYSKVKKNINSKY